jgi:hypothetical protein
LSFAWFLQKKIGNQETNTNHMFSGLPKSNECCWPEKLETKGYLTIKSNRGINELSTHTIALPFNDEARRWLIHENWQFKEEDHIESCKVICFPDRSTNNHSDFSSTEIEPPTKNITMNRRA